MSEAAALLTERRAHARARLNAGLNVEAEAAAREILAQTPDGDTWDILSCALRAQGRVEEAIAASDEALKLAPGAAHARHNRAIAIGRAGRVAEALGEFDALIARGVQAPPLWATRGAALLDLGRIEEAEAAYADGVARWPLDVNLQTALAKTRWLIGAGDRFAEGFEAAVARAPDVAPLRLACVDVLRRAALSEKAEALLREGLARDANQPALLGALGVLLDEADRTEEALPLLSDAVARAPNHADTRALLSRALLRVGRGAEVLALITPMRKADPCNQVWLSQESLALRQTGDARYHDLCDYELMVRAYDLTPPAGYANAKAFNEELALSLMRLHIGEAHPLDQTLRQGTQSSRNLQHVDDAVIQAYLHALSEPIRAYTTLMSKPDHPWSGRRTGKFKLSGAWSARLRPGGYHINHIHPGGWISSAYYVALPEGMNTQAGQQGWIKFGEPTLPMPGCTIEKVVQPKVGRLVLFPSYMWHGTIPFESGERLTAPFDVVPA